jgi:cytochrome c-type biogenesis protein CcmH/NrfF
VVLVLCTLPFILVAAGIAVLLGQPSLSLTLVLWGTMVALIVIFFGAVAWKSRKRSRQSQ